MAAREPVTTIGGIIRRRFSRSLPCAPKTARRITLSVIRIIGSIEANSVPTGQVADSALTSSSTICS